MATTLTSTGITFPNGTTQTTAAGPAGSTITTNTYDATTANDNIDITMNNNGLNFFPRMICSACGPSSRPMYMKSAIGQGWGTCGDGPINYPSTNYQGYVAVETYGNQGSVRCRANYKYITYS